VLVYYAVKVAIQPSLLQDSNFNCKWLYCNSSCSHSDTGQTQRNLKFRLDEHNPSTSTHQNIDATDIV